MAHGNFLHISGKQNLKIVCFSFLFLSFLKNALNSMEKMKDLEIPGGETAGNQKDRLDQPRGC